MATRYWVGGTGNWDATTTHWSASSGGASGASVPTSVDDVIFDNLSNATAYTVTLLTTPVCRSIIVSGPASGSVTFAGTAGWSVYGSFNLSASGVIWSYTGTITFSSTNTGNTITTNGNSLGGMPIIFNGVGGGWTLGSALTTTSNLTFTNGAFNTGNFNCSNSTWTNSGTGTNSIFLGSSTIMLSGNWTFSSVANLTFSAGTSQIIASSSITFAGGGLTYYNFSSTVNSLNSITITGSNTFNNFTVAGQSAITYSYITFPSGLNTTINGTFTIQAGTDYTGRWIVYSSTQLTQATITCNAVSFSTADFADINIQGNAISGGNVTGTSLGDQKGNSNITFSAPKTVYWASTSGGNYQSTNWSNTATSGTGSATYFPLPQDTAIVTNTLPSAGQTINFGVSNQLTAYAGSFDASARTNNLIITLYLSSPCYFFGDLKYGTGIATIQSVGSTGGVCFCGRGVTQNITNPNMPFENVAVINNSTINAVGTVYVDNQGFTGNPINVNAGSTFNLNGYTVNYVATSYSSVQSIFAGTLNLGSGGVLNLPTTNFVGGTVTGTGTLNFTQGNYGKSITTSSGVYYPLTLNNASTGAVGINGGGYFSGITNTYSSTGATTYSFQAGKTTTFNTFNPSGISGNVCIVTATSATTINVYTRPSTLNYISATNITATLTPLYLGTGSTVTTCTNVFASAYVAPFTHYWVGGTGTWDGTTTTHWSATSGGTGGSAAPFGDENVVFNSLSNATAYTVTMSTGAICSSVTVAGPVSGNVTFTSTGAWSVYGSFNLPASGITWSYTGSITFASNVTGNTITTNGISLNNGITFNGAGGGWALGSALTNTLSIGHTNGTLNLATYTATCSNYTTATGTKNLTFNGGTLAVTGGTTTAFNNAAPIGYTTTAGTGTGIISMTSSSAKTFVGGGSTYNCTLNQGGSGALSITGANTFTNITTTIRPSTITFPYGTINTFANFGLSGTAGNLMTINSSSTGTLTLINITSATAINVNYDSFRDISVTGQTFNALRTNGNVDAGNNIGITFGPNQSAFFYMFYP